MSSKPQPGVHSVAMAASKTTIQEPKPRLVDVTSATFDSLPCCGIKSPAHPGRREKCAWLESNAQCGVRAKSLLAPGGQHCGYIEYIPGEFAWRGVDARGYMFIHCIWLHSRQFQRRGWGRLMVEASIDDARKSGMNGVAAMAREGPWMADRRLFLALGFEPVDSAPPDHELLVLKFKKDAANPAFRKDWEKKAAKFSRGLTIIRSGQCPYVVKFAAEIADTALNEYGIKPRIVDLHTAAEAQNAPTPYATFSILYEGKVVADHQISRTRFRNIMRKLREWPPRILPSVHKLPR
jgi:ribosomal protein S18 acetylase RimI-like enzyme